MTNHRPRILAIMGSGETAPPMVTPHRTLLERARGASGTKLDAVMLDTTFGFQENADELTARTQTYFTQSLLQSVDALGLTRIETMDALALASALGRLRNADYAYAGPGSPTYTLRQWRAGGIGPVLADKLATGGTVLMSSAAALTLGVSAVPVYEIYKAGIDPYWEPGLDLLSAYGLPVVVIPHYDNSEGGTHDTRFCYLGETRLAMMEVQLPDDVYVLGVDEQTLLICDLDADTGVIMGRGGVTIRRHGVDTLRLVAGESFALDVLRTGTAAGGRSVAVAVTVAASSDEAAEPVAMTLADETRRLEAAFNDAEAQRDGQAMAAAAVELDAAIVAWSTDSLQSTQADQAHIALRSMIARLGASANSGLRDPREALEPLMGVVLAVRSAVRAEKRYDLSDVIRDQLATVGIEVRDTSDGAQWVLATAP
jgi:hypothetical protein